MRILATWRNASKKTKLPIVLVGIGAQSHDSQQIPVLKGGTLALVKLASSRSSFISVRGDYSQWVLSKYGINNVMATGCPSLLLNGPCIPLIVSPMNFESSSIALHGTRHLFNKSGTLDGYIYRQALQNNIDIILQSELADLYYALNCLGNEVINQKCDDIHRATYEDVREKISKYLQGHGKIFTDIDEWINYLKKSKCFCLGTRFHGTIAALLAGIPATLITHDSRTREMAQKMYIPSVSTEYVDLDSSLVPEKFYDENKIERFKKGFHSYYSEFLRFFSENDIEVSSVFRLIN
jgi:polysaccharide pyruvyl transferase WcaK-like protein